MNIKTITRIAVALALLIVVSIAIPPIPIFLLPVPITLQTVVVLLIGLLLSPNEAATITVLYLVLGSIGFPVFAGGTSGIAIVLGPTGGFLLGMPIAALVMAIMQRFWNTNKVLYKTIIAGVVGTLIIHACGILVWSLVLGTPLLTVVLSDIVFLPGDIIKLIIVVLVWMRLYKLSSFR